MQTLASFIRPTAVGDFRITSFEKEGGYIFALTKGPLHPDGKLHKESLIVRIQSACLFGESFFVNSCDCGAQLKKALELSEDEECFLLIYHMDQEGRGLGLDKKIKVIEFEANNGVNMHKAFTELGYPLDIRTYEDSAKIIKALNGDEAIILMTNNPKKVEGIEKNGIKVLGRKELLIFPAEDQHSLRTYLKVKKKYMGHLLPQVDEDEEM